MEVYVDNILVKSRSEDEHWKNLQEAFSIIKKAGLWLKPGKCAFGVSERRFLGFMITKEGIKLQYEKIEAIINLNILQKTIKELDSKIEWIHQH